LGINVGTSSPDKWVTDPTNDGRGKPSAIIRNLDANFCFGPTSCYVDLTFGEINGVLDQVSQAMNDFWPALNNRMGLIGKFFGAKLKHNRFSTIQMWRCGLSDQGLNGRLMKM